MDQNHVGDLSIWVSLSSLMALFAGLGISLALRLATFASWFLLFPACGVGLPYGWLTAEARQTLSGLLRPAYARCERVGYPHDSRGGSVSSHAEASPACLRQGVLVPSLFSRHHRLCYPRSDDFFLRSLIKDSLAFTRPLFTRGRINFVAKLPLRHYSWLHTLPLPGTHAGIGDRLGHEPGGVLLFPTHDMRFAHRTMHSKNITKT
jgi:hypothetical protein